VGPWVGSRRITRAIGLRQCDKGNEARAPLPADTCDPTTPIGRFEAVIQL
jgi:hypothetical protein